MSCIEGRKNHFWFTPVFQEPVTVMNEDGDVIGWCKMGDYKSCRYCHQQKFLRKTREFSELAAFLEDK